MNGLVARLLASESPAAWYDAHRARVWRWGGRVATDWLDDRSLHAAIAKTVPGQVDWLEGGLGQTPPTMALTRLPSAARAAGASLRVHRIHTLDERLGEVALAFLDAFGEEININAYASPAGAAGLAPHTDPYDVFVLHTAGTKRWFLHGKEGEAPVPYRDATGGNHGELVLEPGDLLFLPAHVRHRAQALDGTSLHLTLSLQAKTKHSLVEWLATEVGNHLDPIDGSPRHTQDDGTYAKAVDALRAAVRAQLEGDVVDRWLRYREGVEYERTIASFETYRATVARGYR